MPTIQQPSTRVFNVLCWFFFLFSYLQTLVTALQTSLKERFKGVFVNVKMTPVQQTSELPFSDDIYLLSSLLDPSFGMFWIDNDVMIDGDAKIAMKNDLKGNLNIGNM